MKKLVAVFLVFMFIISCGERKSNIEIIEDYDNIYFSKEKVDKPAIPNNNNKELISDLKRILKELHGNKSKKMFYPISYKIYIDENGNIDKVMDYTQYMVGYLMASQIEKSNDLTKDNIYINSGRTLEKILPFLEKFKYKPAKLGGKAVPFRTKIKTWGVVDKDGKVTFEISFMNGSSPDYRDNLPITNEDYFVKVEEMPVPIGGLESIQEKIHYPEIAKRAGIEGRVFVKAYIDEKGNVVEIEILKGLGGGCNEVAAEAVKNTKFKPGRQRGKPVKVQVTIPISFKLD